MSLWLFHDGGPYDIEASPLIWSTNQWTDWFLYDRDLRHEKARIYFNWDCLKQNLSLSEAVVHRSFSK